MGSVRCNCSGHFFVEYSNTPYSGAQLSKGNFRIRSGEGVYRSKQHAQKAKHILLLYSQKVHLILTNILPCVSLELQVDKLHTTIQLLKIIVQVL